MYFSKQGLGGHRAKYHIGENHEYGKKLKIRKKNEEKRINLRLAQFMYYKSNTNTHIQPKDINRTILYKLKKDIEGNDMLKNELLKQDYIKFLKEKRKTFNLMIDDEKELSKKNHNNENK